VPAPDIPPDPKRGIQVTMMLADYVDARQGLTIVNGGSNITGPNAMHSLALSFLVPPHMADEGHKVRLELIDMDGNGVGIQGNLEPFVFEAQFNVQREEAMPDDWTIPFSVGLNLGPLGLPPHRTYEWRLMVDDNTHEDWRLVFHTIPPIQGQQRAA
jgi:hypothetical protein